tara:strand:+ start:1671 stop:2297 length:627 start_codon:yes stop_codon:yes gene_type:complete
MENKVKIGVINYGIGNLRSILNCINKFSEKTYLINHPGDIKNFDKIILPGIGSFKKAMEILSNQGWKDEILEYGKISKKPLLGICLGMQILATSGEEFGNTKGLDLIPGKVKHLKSFGCKYLIPHIGWNEVITNKKNLLLKNIPDKSSFYFVNSFAFDAKNKNHEICETEYDIRFTSVINNENIYGTQFHPEKSSKAGSQLLKNFIYA